ncbi:hypothetical protein F3J23_04845 [Chryseobacterium sp. Tr-659]|uniref:aspartyl protease family protein n=1 Tax=Chryseobacterium sp. Tr-659 TaxID=2608340 RepID=UPI00141DBF0C|nr:aspartyl protease family protein [Chryseobacterium sp. Tr-659]NIF04762.1 hypothetical protein [Chryseobacterium sp. Tr-659]
MRNKNLLSALVILFMIISVSVSAKLNEKYNSSVELAILAGKEVDLITKPSVMMSQDRVEIPFEVRKGLIYVKVMLNGMEEEFILDSGAPCIILNSDLEKIKAVSKNTGASVNGVGGNTKMGFAEVQSFDWNGIQIKNTPVRTAPLGNLSKNIAGLIGYDVFNEYQVTFDYKNHKIIVNKGKEISQEKMEYGRLLTIVPFEMQEHIPVFDVEIGGQNYKFGLDTGASANLFHSKFLPELQNFTNDLKEGGLKGLAGIVKSTTGTIESTKIGDLEYKNMRFSFEESTLNQLNAENELGIDGLLGYEFLKEHVIIIDFISNEMRVYNGK